MFRPVILGTVLHHHVEAKDNAKLEDLSPLGREGSSTCMPPDPQRLLLASLFAGERPQRSPCLPGEGETESERGRQ